MIAKNEKNNDYDIKLRIKFGKCQLISFHDFKVKFNCYSILKTQDIVLGRLQKKTLLVAHRTRGPFRW